MTTPLWLTIPESFDPREFLKSPELSGRMDDARYFVDLILTKLSRGEDVEGWVHLAAKYLKKIMHQDTYKDVNTALRDGGAIERSSYKVGGHSFGYRLSERFAKDKHVRVAVADRRLQGPHRAHFVSRQSGRRCQDAPQDRHRQGRAWPRHPRRGRDRASRFLRREVRDGHAGALASRLLGGGLHGPRPGLGDGGDPDLQRAIRVHANFIEYTPFALLLLLLVEMTTANALVVHAFGIALVVSRALHAQGLGATAGYSRGRYLGTLGTWVVITGLALLLVVGKMTIP